MRTYLLIAVVLLPTFLFAQTAPVNGPTTFDGDFSTTGNLLGLTASPGTASNVGSPALYPTFGLVASGWDFTAASSGNVSIGAVAGGAAAGNASDFCIRLNALSGATFSYGDVKANNNTAFSLASVYLKLNITANAPASFTLTGYRGGSPVSGATLTVNSIPTATWTKFDVSGIAAFNNIDQFRFSQATGGTSTITYIVVDEILIAPATALPLTLTDFSGQKKDNNVQLQWTTAMEQNTSYFDIQRGTTSADLQSIGRVDAAGNSNTTQQYQYTDISPVGSSWYYRLTMVDLDGKFTYSPILHIGEPAAQLSLSVYPDPVSTSANLLINSPSAEKGQLFIRDISGKTVLTESLSLQKGSTLYTLPLAGRLPSGVYWLTLVTPHSKQSISILRKD